MTKRKKKKSANTTSPKFSVEITGLILILVGVIGLGVFGPVGNIIKDFAIFLFGSYYNILIILLLVLGMYMLFKRKMPKFFTARLIGFYLILLSGLTLAHMNYVEGGTKIADVLNNSMEVFLSVINENFVGLSQTGGGIIGLFSSWALVSLLDKVGTYIIVSVVIVFGLILMFNISFSDLLDNFGKFLENRREKRKEAKKEAKIAKANKQMEKEDEEEEEDDKVVIKSVEELKKYKNVGEEVQTPTVPVADVPLISINSNYRLPKLDEVLDPLKKNKRTNSDEFIKQTSIALQNVLADFGITGKVVAVHEGPTVTQFEVAVKNGTKVSKITGLSKEIALSLAAKDVRIEAPIPGKTTVGVEIPNKITVGVQVREVIQDKQKEMMSMKLPVSLGKDINGNNCIADLSKTPHLLVAGSTGSGKSVCINSFINSLLITKRPDEVKLVLVDPKKVELSNYNGVPHLLCPVVTDPKKASIALQNIVKEMEKRYDMFADEKVKNIVGYNEKMSAMMKKNPEDKTIHLMSYIVVIIDELADLMLVASKEVEDSIMRITQMARAAGIHLIVATQRPSTDVITGVVKANIPSRIALSVSSAIDSRTIIDGSGAEKLLGNGDMLFAPQDYPKPVRVQGAFVSDEERDQVVAFLKEHMNGPAYNEEISKHIEENPVGTKSAGASGAVVSGPERDELFVEAAKFIIEKDKASIGMLQRVFRIGFNRAARIMDQLSDAGVVGPEEGTKPRVILMSMEQFENYLEEEG